jgi:hypothetical protein
VVDVPGLGAGVPLATLFREAGVKPGAKWFIAEGGDAARLSRSIPLEKALDDALLVWGQNGEALRPSNGYPVRLLLPGFEGNTSIKWIRRLELSDQPNMSKDETSKYTDPIPGSKARQFSFLMDVKSVITSPAYPQQLTERGWWPIRGLAWTGRGRIAKVEVSADGGKSWQQARLEGNNLPLAPVRFEQMWKWGGSPAVLLSRATESVAAKTGDGRSSRRLVASAPTTTSATSGDGPSVAMAWCGTERTREARAGGAPAGSRCLPGEGGASAAAGRTVRAGTDAHGRGSDGVEHEREPDGEEPAAGTGERRGGKGGVRGQVRGVSWGRGAGNSADVPAAGGEGAGGLQLR